MSLSSATQVMSTPELLEQILAALPMRDLLVNAPLVSRTWRAITLLSTIQQALFFQPAPSISPRVLNPLLSESFPPFFASYDKKGWESSVETIMRMPWSKAPDAFRRREASWRRMLVRQPPAQSLVVKQTSGGMAGSYDREGALKDPSLSMAVLYDLTLQFVDGDTSFHFMWHDESAAEGDLTLNVSTGVGCESDGERIEKKYFSDAANFVKVSFGEWEGDEISRFY
ncbi:putative MFS transporter [Favolaschia claudopus]|uniref:MFS transporter n=1 Tax=Favolaschia claudopus TaxID=2862362 RepID=A0AAW0D7H2_9AGAR